MNIEDYFDLSTCHKQSSSALLDWCKGKPSSALAQKIGPKDSFSLRLELLKLATVSPNRYKPILPYILYPSFSPHKMKPKVDPEVALDIVIKISDKAIRHDALSFFEAWDLPKDYLLQRAQLFTQILDYELAFNLLAAFDYLQEPIINVTSRIILPILERNNYHIILAEVKANQRFGKTLLKDMDSLIFLSDHEVSMPSEQIRKFIHKLLKDLHYKEADYPTLAPNFIHAKCLNALRYHLKNYENYRLNDWRDCLSWNLDKYPKLIPEAQLLLSRLFGDDEVNYWNGRYHWDLTSTKSAFEKKKQTSCTSGTRTFMELDVSFKKIIQINSVNFSQFRLALIEASPSSTGRFVSGYDSEFADDFGLFQTRVVLMQITIEDKVFLLDMLELVLYPHFLEFLRDHYFNNPNVTLLGFGISSDFNALSATHSIFSGMKITANVVDLLKLSGFITKELSIPLKKSCEKGLAGLIESLFGCPLDKSFQRSFWMRRPLEREQVIYGAMDARVLVRAYDKLMMLSLHRSGHPKYKMYFGAGVEFHPESIAPERKNKRRRRKKMPKSGLSSLAKATDLNPPNSPRVNDPSQTGFICNTMLHGLTKKLRAFGIDTVFIETSDPEHLADSALASNRVILSRGKIVERIRSRRPDVSVYHVDSDKAQDQVEEIIRDFNISVDEADIFTRCVACNCDRYIHASQSQMEALMAAKTSPSRKSFLVDSVLVSTPSMQIPSGTILRLSEVKIEVLQTVEEFFICTNCGHVYWKGSHWEKMRKKRENLERSVLK